MLRPWKLSLAEIGAESDQSLRMRIVHGLIRDIQHGRLSPGSFLPSSRELAASVGVNRKTIVLVYDELKAQGWLEATSTRGTRVAVNLPEQLPGRIEGRPGPGERPEFDFDAKPGLLSITPDKETLTLDLGSPDCRLFPAEVLGRAYRDAAVRASRARRLSYGDPRGSLALRENVAAMLGAQRGMVVQPEHALRSIGGADGSYSQSPS